MIQPLRVAHRRVFVGMAAVLPAILWIGLGSRTSLRSEPPFAADVPAGASVIRESGIWQKHAIHSTLYRRPDRPQEVDVALQSPQGLDAPDLLLYWAANAPRGNSLPSEAKLVGAFRTGRTFPIQLNEPRTGYLVLFSAAHQSVFDTARVEKLP